MNLDRISILRYLFLAIFSLALAACGGGGSGGSATPVDPTGTAPPAPAIMVTGAVDTATDGNYLLNYTVDDPTGNSAVPVIRTVSTEIMNQVAAFDVSNNGTLVYSPGTPIDRAQFVWVDMAGKVLDSLALPENFYGAFSLSPDGSKLAYGLNGPESEIWVYDLESQLIQKLTTGGWSQYPIWTPDGQWITYSSLVNNRWEIYRQNLNTTSEREQLTNTGNIKISGSWSPDGELLTFYEVTPNESRNMYVLSMKDREITEPLHNTSGEDNQPRFSPDGKYVSYYSSESGGEEIYVEPYPPTGKRWQVSGGSTGAVDAVWSPKGDRIYYRGGGSQNIFSSVKLTTNENFTHSSPEILFAGKPYVDVFDKSFDVSADGERLLVLQQVNSNEQIYHLEVVVNWTEELKRLVPLEEE